MKANPDICDIIVAGQDGGYGECILAHIGGDDWVIIDSCIDPESKEPIILKLLEEYGIDPEKVILIVCTHWHKDHINGLSKVLETCPNAKFSFARAIDEEKFFRFIEFDYKHKAKFNNSVTDEFRKCLEVISRSRNKKRIKRASADQVLFSKRYKGKKVSVSSLSPSDKALTDFEVELTKLSNEKTLSNIRIPKQSPNDKSVVILLEIGDYSVLLGADLEVKDNDEYGWLNITRKSSIISGAEKSKLFKIPHHGSKNGYHQEIWDKLLEEKPHAIITPFNTHSLPSEKYVNLYDGLTESLSLTSRYKKSKRAKKRERSVDKLVKDLVPTMREIKKSFGVIHCSLDLTNSSSQWTIEYQGEAFKYT